MKRRTVQLLEALVLGLAAAVRVANIWSVDQTAYAAHPMVDAYTYWDQATAMLAGRDPFAAGFYQPPGYPVFLWLLARLTGGADLDLLRAVHALLGLLTTGLLILLGRRLGQARSAPWAGALAGALYAFYPTTLLFEQDVLTPALTGALFTASLVLLSDGREADPRSGRPAGPRPGRAAAAGLLLGLTVVVHPTYLLAAMAGGGWLAVQAWRLRGDVPLTRRAAAVTAFSLALALALAPTAWQNTVTHKQPALVSHNSGLNFYLGNNVAWRDTMFLRPGLPFRKLVLQADPATRGAAERNSYWWSRAQAELAAHPLAALSIVATKALWSVNNVEIPRNEDYRCRTSEAPLSWLRKLPVRYGIVLPFALGGAVLLSRRRGPARLVPLCWVALHLPLLIFLVADRYRLATWPLVCLAASVGVTALVELLRERRWPAPSWWLLALVLPLPFVPLDARTHMDPAWCLHVQGNLALMDGDTDHATSSYQQALALDDQDWGARDFLARTLAGQGQVDPAIALMEPLVDWFPDHYPSLYFLSGLYQRRGELDQAAALMGRAYAVPGKRRNTGVRYVELLVRAGHPDQARAVVAEHAELQNNAKLSELLR